MPRSFYIGIFRRPSCLALLLVVAMGCGHKSGTAKVSGHVTLDGKPLTSGTVITAPQAGRAAKGTIGPDGSFELGTITARDGAILGTHKIGVLAYENANQGPEGETGKLLVPKRYTNPDTSGLIIEVKADGSNTAELSLTSP